MSRTANHIDISLLVVRISVIFTETIVFSESYYSHPVSFQANGSFQICIRPIRKQITYFVWNLYIMDYI